MENPNDTALAQLRADWPLWQFWTVYHLPPLGTVWCARRHADRDAVPARVLNADSAEHLAEYIADEVSK